MPQHNPRAQSLSAQPRLNIVRADAPKHDRRASEVRAADLDATWTRISPRLLRTPGVARAFAAVAPLQLQQLTLALQLRAVDRVLVAARALHASTESIGARGLSALVMAVWADCASFDWPVAEARVASLQPYVASVLHKANTSSWRTEPNHRPRRASATR